MYLLPWIMAMAYTDLIREARHVDSLRHDAHIANAHPCSAFIVRCQHLQVEGAFFAMWDRHVEFEDNGLVNDYLVVGDRCEGDRGCRALLYTCKQLKSV